MTTGERHGGTLKPGKDPHPTAVLMGFCVGVWCVYGMLVAVLIINGYNALVGLQYDGPAVNVTETRR